MEKLQVGQRLRVELQNETYEGTLKSIVKEDQCIELDKAEDVQTKEKSKHALSFYLPQIVKLSIVNKPAAVANKHPSTSATEPQTNAVEEPDAEDVGDDSVSQAPSALDSIKQPENSTKVSISALEMQKITKQWQQVTLINELGKHYDKAINSMQHQEMLVIIYERPPQLPADKPPPLTIAYYSAVHVFDPKALAGKYTALKQILESNIEKCFYNKQHFLELYKEFGIKIMRGTDMVQQYQRYVCRQEMASQQMELHAMLHAYYQLPADFFEAQSHTQHDQLVYLAKRAVLMCRMHFHLLDTYVLKDIYKYSEEYSQLLAGIESRVDLIPVLQRWKTHTYEFKFRPSDQ